MHEASLVLGMVPVIEKHLKDNNGDHINKVITRIGRVSGVEVETFSFAFEAIKLDYPWLKDAQLEIIEEPAIYHCHECNHEFEVDSFDFPVCEKCMSPTVELIKGEEMLLESLEIEQGEFNNV
jgi:hydrogenase nickel incorporation protein HypA/HybF